MRRIRASFLLVVSLLIAGCASAPEPAEGPDAQTLGFTDTDGARHDVPPEGANATVVFFMATWCPTCKQETPMVASLHEAYAARGVQFFSLDFDPTETPEQVEAWKSRYAQPWPHGIDVGMRVQRALGVVSESSIALLDRDGALVEVWEHGRATEDAVGARLDAVLA